MGWKTKDRPTFHWIPSTCQTSHCNMNPCYCLSPCLVFCLKLNTACPPQWWQVGHTRTHAHTQSHLSHQAYQNPWRGSCCFTRVSRPSEAESQLIPGSSFLTPLVCHFLLSSTCVIDFLNSWGSSCFFRERCSSSWLVQQHMDNICFLNNHFMFRRWSEKHTAASCNHTLNTQEEVWIELIVFRAEMIC